jgi:hypothetical protein
VTFPVTASLDDCGCDVDDVGGLGCCESGGGPAENELDVAEPHAASINAVTAETINALR